MWTLSSARVMICVLAFADERVGTDGADSRGVVVVCFAASVRRGGSACTQQIWRSPSKLTVVPQMGSYGLGRFTHDHLAIAKLSNVRHRSDRQETAGSLHGNNPMSMCAGKANLP